MKLYFDTEFTGLKKDTTLVSIGIVDQVERKFYAELSDWDKSYLADDWFRTNVYSRLLFPNLISNQVMPLEWGDPACTYVFGSKDYVGNQLRTWLKPYTHTQMVSDVCHYDMVLLIDLFGGTAFDLPEGMSAVCHDINQDIARFTGKTDAKAFDLSREVFIRHYAPEIYRSLNFDKHNALFDAKIISTIDRIISTIRSVPSQNISQNKITKEGEEMVSHIEDMAGATADEAFDLSREAIRQYLQIFKPYNITKGEENEN